MQVLPGHTSLVSRGTRDNPDWVVHRTALGREARLMGLLGSDARNIRLSVGSLGMFRVQKGQSSEGVEGEVGLDCRDQEAGTRGEVPCLISLPSSNGA